MSDNTLSAQGIREWKSPLGWLAWSPVVGARSASSLAPGAAASPPTAAGIARWIIGCRRCFRGRLPAGWRASPLRRAPLPHRRAGPQPPASVGSTAGEIEVIQEFCESVSGVGSINPKTPFVLKKQSYSACSLKLQVMTITIS